MTGDHEHAHDDRSRQSTTITAGPAAGWYPDPGDPAALRYFDGAAWTHHVAPRPAPAPAPAYSAAPAYSPAPAYGAATAYGSSPAWPAPPPPASRSFSLVRVLITVALVLVVLSEIAGGLRGMATSLTKAQPAPGPALTLGTTPPSIVVGRLASRTTEATKVRGAALAQLTPSLRMLPGSTPAKLEIYGPGPASAPKRGLGVLMLAWTGTSTLFSQGEFARGFSDGANSSMAGTVTTTAAPDGGEVVCVEGTTDAGPTTLCAWIRSGTGLVMLAEYGVGSDTVRTDLGGVVAKMARPRA